MQNQGLKYKYECMYRRVLQALPLRQTWAQIPTAPLPGPVTLGMFCETEMTLKSLCLSQGVEVRMRLEEQVRPEVQPSQVRSAQEVLGFAGVLRAIVTDIREETRRLPEQDVTLKDLRAV